MEHDVRPAGSQRGFYVRAIGDIAGQPPRGRPVSSPTRAPNLGAGARQEATQCRPDEPGGAGHQALAPSPINGSHVGSQESIVPESAELGSRVQDFYGRNRDDEFST